MICSAEDDVDHRGCCILDNRDSVVIWLLGIPWGAGFTALIRSRSTGELYQMLIKDDTSAGNLNGDLECQRRRSDRSDRSRLAHGRRRRNLRNESMRFKCKL